MTADAQRRYKERHPDRVREADRRYAATENGRESHRRAKAAWKVRNRAASREKDAARERLRVAVLRGIVTKAPCFCGEVQVHGHHPNGYQGLAALDVTWLCPRHHAEAHR